MKSSGVPVVFETRETLAVLDGWSGVGPVDFSKRIIEMGWKQDESETREGVLTLVKLENSNTTSIKQYLVLFWRKFTLTSTRDLRFKCLVVNMALCQSRRSPCKFSGFTWFAIVFVHRPLPKH